MENPFVTLRKIKVERKDEDDCVPQLDRERSMSAKLVDMDSTIDCVVRAVSLERTTNDEKSDQVLVRPKAPRGRPRKSQLKAITSGQENVKEDIFSNTDSSVRSGNQTLDSSSAFIHSERTSNVKINLRKRKSEINTSGSRFEHKSPRKNSMQNSSETHQTTLLKSRPGFFRKPIEQPTRFNAYMALPDDPVRARQWSAKDWDVTLLHLLPKCMMTLKIHDPTTIIVMEGCIEIRNDSLVSSCIVLESKTKPLDIDAGQSVQIGNMGSEVATFQTITGMDPISLSEDAEQPVRYNAYKARCDDPVNAQQLVSDEDVRISLIHLQPKGYLPLKIHDPMTIVLIKGRINIIKDIAVTKSALLDSSMESIEIEKGKLIHVANFGHEIAKFQAVEFLK